MTDKRTLCSHAEVVDPVTARRRARDALARTTELMVLQHYSPRSVETYVAWLRRFVRFHLPRDPGALDHQAVTQFLSALAIRGRVSASTQNQARSALVFYFRQVRKSPLPMLEGVTPATRPRRLPVVLSGDEVFAILARRGHVRRGHRLAPVLRWAVGPACDFSARDIVRLF